MYLTLDQIPAEAAAQIFPFRKAISDAQKESIQAELIDFLKVWCSHEQPIATALWMDNYQIVLFVDKKKVVPSGCALDKWTRKLNEIGSTPSNRSVLL